MKNIFNEKSVVVVTGASSGMGEEVALACARQGATVVIIARGSERLGCVAHKIIASGGKPLTAPADVCNRSAMESIASKVEKEYGKVDLLVNAAGIGLLGSVKDTTEEAARRVFDVNYFGVLNCVQVFLPLLRKGKNPAVVNIASTVGKVGWPGMGVYSASKAAVCNFSDALRLEFKNEGIKVLLVCPGYTQTNFLKNAIKIGGNKDEASISGGLLPFDVATGVLKAIAGNKKEIVLGRTKEKIILVLNRFFRPVADFLLWKMSNR